MVSSKNNFKFWTIFLPNALLMYLALWVSLELWYRGVIPQMQQHYSAFSVVFIFWLLVFFIYGLFEAQIFRRYTSLIFKLASAMSVNLVLAAIYFYFQPALILTPRRFLFVLLIVTFIFILCWDLLVKSLLQNRLVENIFLLSKNDELKDLESAIKDNPYFGFRVAGYVNLDDLAKSESFKEGGIVLPDSLNLQPQVAEGLYKLRTLGVKFYNHRDFYEQLLRKIYLSEINEIWFLENIDYQENRLYNILKKLIDLFFGFLGILVFLISYPFCALAIKISDPNGPVLFKQQRVGKKGKIFTVYKYRTMISGMPTNTWTSVNDPRILKIGKFLRKSRIDEFPQFINLILGNISLVGPRPEQPQIVEDLKKQIPFYDERHLVKPGITGWAQINNIYAGSSEETKLKLQYDLYYIKHRSILFDLEIILKTMYYIFTWKGR